MKTRGFVSLAIPLVLAFASSGGWTVSAGLGPGVGVVPQGTQSDAAYARSFQTQHVINLFATTQKTSCYRPEDPYFTVGTGDGYTGMSPCNGTANTGEDIGVQPYPQQTTSNAGFPAAGPVLVKNHSESDIRVDPTNPMHLIGSSKWFVSAEGYNHLLGFYESFDGGKTWPVQGHIPGYEGWTDNTDPVGAFDGFGNFYEFLLPYQFFYNADGSHNFQTNPNEEPNRGVPAEVVAVTVRPHGATTATQWITTHNGHTDTVFIYPVRGREPDKQWIGIDTNPSSPHFNRVYVGWTLFDSFSAVPFFSFADAKPDGTHNDWATPIKLPIGTNNPQGDTFVFPRVDPDGVVYTTVTNFEPSKGFCCAKIVLDKSMDGGVSWQTISTAMSDIAAPPLIYPNTEFRDGIENTFAVGPEKVNGHFPLYIAYEDHSTGFGNIILTASFDGGMTWGPFVQVNDNASVDVDEFQPNLAVASDGTVSVAFYDRRLSCPAAGTAEAAGAGIALDTFNPNFSGTLPPFGASNYCVNASIQFYKPNLTPIGHNIRLTQHTWDPQLNTAHPHGILALEGFIGDYFGNDFSGPTDFSSFVSTFDDGSNSSHFQQQVVATVAIP